MAVKVASERSAKPVPAMVLSPTLKGRFRFLRRKKSHDHWIEPAPKAPRTSYHGAGAGVLGLPQDLLLQVVGFLNEEECYAVMGVNRYLQKLLSNDCGSGQHVWKCLLQQQWPYLTKDRMVAPGQDMRTLLRLKANTAPTNVGDLVSLLHALDSEDGNPEAIEFTGVVGSGNRSFRSNHPFVCPVGTPTKRPSGKHLFKRIRRRERSSCATNFQPFVLPFQTQDGHFCLTPRLISYFEVSITEPGENAQPRGAPWQATGSECVAVGLSTSKFQLHRRLPGWDDISYGYHGDDGSKFHKQAIGNKYAQRFGAGDVVGCGINYQEKSIFYTLNGRFLGYANTLGDEELQKEWYPTVGIDSRSVCQFNFGKTPFMYDLEDMIQRNWLRPRLVKS